MRRDLSSSGRTMVYVAALAILGMPGSSRAGLIGGGQPVENFLIGGQPVENFLIGGGQPVENDLIGGGQERTSKGILYGGGQPVENIVVDCADRLDTFGGGHGKAAGDLGRLYASSGNPQGAEKA